MYYKYGITFCYGLPTYRDVPRRDKEDKPYIKVALPTDKFKAYVFYSTNGRYITPTEEKAYHLEYLGRSNERR